MTATQTGTLPEARGHGGDTKDRAALGPLIGGLGFAVRTLKLAQVAWRQGSLGGSRRVEGGAPP